MATKICSKCKEEKDVSEFYKDKKKKDGLTCWCKICSKKHEKENKDRVLIKKKEYYFKNIENIKKYRKTYYKNNKEIIKTNSINRNKNNKEHKSITDREYYIKNKEKIINRQKEYSKNNKDKILKYRNENIESSFCRKSLERILRDYKGSRSKYEKLLGYTIKDLKLHLSKFGDIKSKQYHIDHIIPISALSEFIKDQFILARFANDLRNLMLLTKKENNFKRAKLTIEYVPYFHLQDFIDYCLEVEEFISNQSSSSSKPSEKD